MFLILVYLLLFPISSLESWTAQKCQAGISNLNYSVLTERLQKSSGLPTQAVELHSCQGWHMGIGLPKYIP